MAKYDVKVKYAFEGTYTVVAEDRDQAERMVTEDCGLVLGGNIHTTCGDDEVTDWNFDCHPDVQVLSFKERSKKAGQNTLPWISAAGLKNSARTSLKQYVSCSMHTD